jgi:predicted lipoprotein with Yx(FWY)xxD motif
VRLRAIAISLTLALTAAGALAVATNAAKSPTVKTRHSAAVGTYLVDAKGKSLYLFKKDTGKTSKCAGMCAQAWPPLTVNGSPKAGSGVKASKLSTSKRTGGARQVTYNGHPLYHFSGDSKAGDTNGQGSQAFGARWYLVTKSGKAITGGY